MSAKQCREERAEIIKQLGEMVNKAKAEKRALNKDEQDTFDRMDSAAKGLLEKAEGYERIETYDGLTVAEARASIKEVQTLKPFTNHEDRNRAYLGWFYHGSKMQRREYWQAAERQGIDCSNPNMRFDWKPETRAFQAIVPSTAGGDVVQVDNALMTNIDIALKQYGGMRAVSTVVRTSTGANLPWPTTDDTSILAEEVGEGAQVNDQPMSFGQRVLNAWKYDTGFLKVSWELMTDSVIDLPALIGRQGGIRLARRLNKEFSTGQGNAGPQGILTGATLGATSASASAIAYADLLNLYHSVDPAYRDRPDCVFMFHDSVYHQLRALTDQNLRPLLMSSLEGIEENPGAAGMLLGKRFIVNQQFPTFAATGAPIAIAFGDFSKYIIRDVAGEEGGFNLLRLNERFADQGLVAYLGWSRHDGMLSDAGTHPVQYLQMKA